jgi:hypothetical protein
MPGRAGPQGVVAGQDEATVVEGQLVGQRAHVRLGADDDESASIAP